jgi:hypothetical protein
MPSNIYLTGLLKIKQDSYTVLEANELNVSASDLMERKIEIHSLNSFMLMISVDS